MIDWIIDRVWAWRHRKELAALDAQMRAIGNESARLDAEMEKAFGPNWREQSEKRLREAIRGWYSVS